MRFYGVTGYAVGPIYMKSEAEIDRGFEYAETSRRGNDCRRTELRTLPYVDKKAKE